ncbi:MAG: HlyD family type I secretion periplasmic adaptor subunit [Pseudomonadota bacterium]
MEPTNKPHLNDARGTELEFLPDADAIERSPLPPYLRITIHVMFLALVSFVVWASVSQIDRVVVTKGRLVNPLPNIVVQPLETAIVQAVHVRLGQVVKKGELLATLDPTFTKADEDQLRTRLRSLDTQTHGLQAELAGSMPSGRAGTDSDSKLQAELSTERQANYRAQMDKLTETVARLKASQVTNKLDQDALTLRLKSAHEVEDMYERLVKENFGAKLHLLEARDKRLEVERTLQTTIGREAEIRRELASSEAEASAFHKNWRQKQMEELLSTSRDRDQVNEQLAKADKRHQLVSLVAPADGVVLEIAKLSPGSVIKEAETFFTLVPLGGVLEAEVQIDAVDVGYVKLGDVAQVKLDAFPFQKHGSIKASVRVITSDTFKRESGVSGGPDAYYLSRVHLGDAKLKKMAPNDRLLPGMTLNAEIVVGKRTVMSYLLWPLTKAMDESIREP